MMPSIRTVLLKTFDEQGFVFFTNYKSKKSKTNRRESIQKLCPISLVSTWRQVKIEGSIEKISKTDSLKYFYLD